MKKKPINLLKTATETAERMLEIRDTMKRLKGDKWQADSLPYRDLLNRLMKQHNTDNPLAVATPIAKELDEKGVSPLMLLAVAADMADAWEN